MESAPPCPTFVPKVLFGPERERFGRLHHRDVTARVVVFWCDRRQNETDSSSNTPVGLNLDTVRSCQEGFAD
jgi:hypothetical protein